MNKCIGNMSYIKRVTNKIRSACGPLDRTVRKGWFLGQLDENWKVLDDWNFWRKVRTRGTHVNTPKKGSRGDAFCLGGI
jgi:hypothetical protein